MRSTELPNLESKLNWRERASLVFGIDVRSMAVFRLVMGGMLLLDLALRWPTLRLMCTDDGIVTREVVADYWRIIFQDHFSAPWISVHHLSGSFEYQVALFAVAAFFAVCLSAGFMTRIATFASWFLLASLHARNPMILSSGDMIMKMMLFWSIFLPLGRVWSIDAILKKRQLAATQHWISDIATAGFLIQFGCMYVFTGLSKCNAIWFHGDAMEYVMRLDIYVLPAGKQLLNYPGLLKFITISTVVVEVISPFLLLIPFRNHWFRLLNILIYWSLHLSIAMTMSIGLFSYISMMGWLMFLPTVIWTGKNWQASFRNQNEGQPASHESWQARLQPAFRFAGVAMILLIIGLNIQNTYSTYGKRFLNVNVEGAAQLMMWDQYFRMFDVPPPESPWFVYQARLKDQSQVDIFTGEKPTAEKPESVRIAMKYHHLRKLHRNMVTIENAPQITVEIQKIFRTALAEYYVKKWNESNPESKQVRSFSLTCHKHLIGPHFNPQNRRSAVWYEIKPPGSVFEQELENLEKGIIF